MSASFSADFEIWAPEEDSSDYYGLFRPFGFVAGTGATSTPGEIIAPFPPAGVDASAFYNLLNRRQGGFIDNMLAIDKAANNSGIVFCLKWRGWKRLFTGDAEHRSWKEMNKEHTLSECHFLKISHHGSHNGTPGPEILSQLFPTNTADHTNRYAGLSTYEHTYNGIPHQNILDELREDYNCNVQSTLDYEDGKPLVLKFQG